MYVCLYGLYFQIADSTTKSVKTGVETEKESSDDFDPAAAMDFVDSLEPAQIVCFKIILTNFTCN